MFLFVSIILVFLFYLLCLKPFGFWKQRGVAQYTPWVTLCEIILSFVPYRPITDVIQNIYNDFPDKRYCGIYQFYKPTLFIKDSELLKQLAVKDFDHFVDHSQALMEDTEPIWEKNLFFLKGEKWKDMRATLSPSFTSSKMKMMFGLISDYAKQFTEFYEKQSGIVSLEMKDTFTRFTNDVIATTAFGINCDSIRNPNNEFYLMGKELTKFDGLLNNLKFVVILMLPRFAKILGLTVFTKRSRNFFSKLVGENLKSREESGIVRTDMIYLLMEARKGRSQDVDDKKLMKQPLTEMDITAQALIFFFAGFDSVSTQMCFLAHELAVNVDVQERLHKEIDDVLVECDGSVTYEALMKMKYMDMVVSECLRKWPAAVVVDRVCVKPYVIEPVNDKEKPLHVEKGEVIWIPIFAMHRDPKYFAEPERFDPDRFNDENKNTINPYVYVPFGVGPRSCIGNRFALMEMKLAFFHLLTKFDLVIVEKTTVPLKIKRSAFQLMADGGFWLGLKPRCLS